MDGVTIGHYCIYPLLYVLKYRVVTKMFTVEKSLVSSIKDVYDDSEVLAEEYRRPHVLDCRHENPFDSPSVQRALGITRSRCSYCGVLYGGAMRFCDRCGAPR